MRIIARLDEIGWKQVDLAREMEVTPQQVNKWVKGNENFTIKTLNKIGEVLRISLIQVTPLNETSKTDFQKNVIE